MRGRRGGGEESASWKATSRRGEGRISDFKLQTSKKEEELIPTVARVSRGRLCVLLRARDLGIFGWLGREGILFGRDRALLGGLIEKFRWFWSGLASSSWAAEGAGGGARVEGEVLGGFGRGGRHGQGSFGYPNKYRQVGLGKK